MTSRKLADEIGSAFSSWLKSKSLVELRQAGNREPFSAGYLAALRAPAATSLPSEDNVTRLADAMWQLLDDMGEHGLNVCPAAKKQAIEAYAPFAEIEAAPPAPEPVQNLHELSADADDPTADERWNKGCDFALMQLCEFLGVDPGTVCWDAASETVDGDVSSVIGNILRARFGEDWGVSDLAAKDRKIEALREALRSVLEGMTEAGNQFEDKQNAEAWDTIFMTKTEARAALKETGE